MKEEELKNYWDSLWNRTINGNFLQRILNYFAEQSTDACWQMYAHLLSKCTFNSNPRILELGAGSGNMTLRILKRFGGTATLVDYSAQALQVAKLNSSKEGLTERISFIQSNVLDFVPQEGYDLVHSGGLIEHFPKSLVGKVMRKHAECAYPKGYVIIMVPAPIWWYKVMRTFLEVFRLWLRDFEMPLSKAQLKIIAEENGLKVLEAIQSSGLARASAILSVSK